MRLPRAALTVAAAYLERVAANLHEATLAKPSQRFYAGYEQGVRDGAAEHALKWLAGKDEHDRTVRSR